MTESGYKIQKGENRTQDTHALLLIHLYRCRADKSLTLAKASPLLFCLGLLGLLCFYARTNTTFAATAVASTTHNTILSLQRKESLEQ